MSKRLCHNTRRRKYRYRILERKIKEYVEKKIRAICEWKHVEILELTIMPDHIHMVAIIQPKLGTDLHSFLARVLAQ
jgi:REP element-mobilizing transposase RayT